MLPSMEVVTVAYLRDVVQGTDYEDAPIATQVPRNLEQVFLRVTDIGGSQITVPARLLNWSGKFGAGSYGGVFAMGATSGLVAAPCGAWPQKWPRWATPR